MLNGYSPVFTNAPESLYEMELTRAAIHSFANFCSKLKPEISGTAYKNLERVLQFRPNPFMDTSKFIYRIATILSVNNTAFIVPIEDEYGGIAGYYPLLPQRCEVVEYRGAPFLRYTFANGQRAAIEFERVGVMTQFQYSDDFFGESNAALRPTMQLIHTQNQGIINGVKNSASVRFLAKVANMLKPEDITKERKRFTADNLSADNQSGMVIYDSKFADVKPIESKPFTVNAAQMAQINENVFNYFGTNAKIIQNSYTEDEWNAYYEGKVEPFAIQLSLVMSNMTYTQRELSFGNAITFTANRLQYASNNTKLNISTQLFDRGLLNRNGVMDIWNMSHVEGGDKYYIRKEYAEVSELGKEVTPNASSEGTEYRQMFQPLILSISTAGYENDGIFDELMARSTAFLKGGSKERRLLPLLYMIDDVEKWNDLEELKKANPNMGVSVSPEFFKEEIAVAEMSLSKRAEFLCKYCNIKQNSSVAWLDYVVVDRAGEKIKLEDFKDSYAVGGIDLSQTTDLTAASVIIERGGVLYAFAQFFMPANRLETAQAVDGVPYDIFVKQGIVKLSGENHVDYRDVYEWFSALRDQYGIYILKIGYDRYSAQYLIDDLKAAGFQTDDVWQGENLAPVIREFEGIIKDGNFKIADNNLLKAHFLNVALKHNMETRKFRPVKIEQRARIDGFVSVIDAMTVRQKYYNEIGEMLKNAG